MPIENGESNKFKNASVDKFLTIVLPSWLRYTRS